MIFRPGSLFARTAITLAITLTAFLAVDLVATYSLVVTPMKHQSADDFAADLVNSAHTLAELPEQEHEQMLQHLLRDHELIVTTQEPLPRPVSSDSLYLRYFRDALKTHAGEDLRITESADSPIIWVDVPVDDEILRMGFDRGRLGTNHPLALVLVVSGGILLTLVASLFEVRRVTKPLESLSLGVRKLGMGLQPPPIPEDGPEEIAEALHAFNKTVEEMRQLAENRAVMLAGISHDLRTPLTRLGIAVEMLDPKSKPELIARIRRDLETMNTMIGQFLQYSKGIEDQNPSRLNLWHLLESVADDLELEHADVRLRRNDPPCVYYTDQLALERVLNNLLKNAVQYSGGQPVDVDLHCTAQAVSIDIADRGPGIPPEETDGVFKPFYRLESSRNTGTGGSGLGLAIARQIALKHGWSIELTPRDGGGTVAKIGLPTSNRFNERLSECAVLDA